MPIKHCLWRQGLIASPECRLPLSSISDGLAQEDRSWLDTANAAQGSTDYVGDRNNCSPPPRAFGSCWPTRHRAETLVDLADQGAGASIEVAARPARQGFTQARAGRFETTTRQSSKSLEAFRLLGSEVIEHLDRLGISLRVRRCCFFAGCRSQRPQAARRRR